MALLKKIKYRKEMIEDIESGYLNEDYSWANFKIKKLERYKKELSELEEQLEAL